MQTYGSMRDANWVSRPSIRSEAGLDIEARQNRCVEGVLELGEGALHTIGDLAVARVSSGVRRPILVVES
ncbi:MAG: hypothetical protein O7I42_24535 [Alphaproteobacteria bacterium]|nr:hypothetical protein [Alphaproteobacteria bacterium]